MNDTETILQTASALLQALAVETRTPEANRLDVMVTRDNLHAAVEALTRARWGYLAAITGLDLTPPSARDADAQTELEALYHFCSRAAVVTLRVRVPGQAAFMPTICDLIPAASPFERELQEMFGIQVIGTPDATRLYLPDDWQDGVYPLRKDFGVTESES